MKPTTAILLGALASGAIPAAGAPPAIDPSVELAHREIWRRFLHPQAAIILDHAGLDGRVVLPTAAECRAGKPNGLAWGCSTEDGPMFGGLYLEAMMDRWKITGQAEDRDKARRIAEGLMRVATCSATPGFIARGLSDDGTAWHPIGSNDQTFPWLYGMWRYLRSDIPDEAERARIRAEIIEVATTLRDLRWLVPCDRAPFDYRGSFGRFDWESAPRLLFIARMAADVTGEAGWMKIYRDLLDEINPKHPGGKPTRRDLCLKGMVFHDANQGQRHTWTACPGVASLRALWEMEADAEIKAVFEQGLRASAELAAQSLPLALQFDNDDRKEFLLDWRKIHDLWREQGSVAEAHQIAQLQLRRLAALSPRRVYEMEIVREPLYAAWTVTLCPDAEILKRHAPAVLQAIRHYRYDRLYLSQFFPAEDAYYRLRLAGLAGE